MNRAGLVHGYNAVNQGYTGRENRQEVHQQRGKPAVSTAVNHVPPGFMKTGETTKIVFNRQSDPHLGVGLDPRQVDQEIAVHGRCGEGCLLTAGKNGFPGPAEFHHRDPEGLEAGKPPIAPSTARAEPNAGESPTVTLAPWARNQRAAASMNRLSVQANRPFPAVIRLGLSRTCADRRVPKPSTEDNKLSTA